MEPAEGGSAAAPQALTSKNFWDRTWRRPVNHRQRAKRLARLVSLDWQKAQMLIDAVNHAESLDGPPLILEVGCGNSGWLPYLARELQASVVGVDYSEAGCELAQQNLAASGVDGTVVCEDFFNYATRVGSTFDAIVSFGVIEHFDDVPAVLATMATTLKPGGVLVATVPNLAGVYGPLQGAIDPEVLRQHVILPPPVLSAHALAAGLVNVRSGYIGGPIRLSALNFGHLRWLPSAASRAWTRGLFEFDSAVGAIARSMNRTIAGPRTAPYVFLTASSPPR